MAKQQEKQKHKDLEKDKVQSDITEKVLHINRCAKVVTGGRKFSFSALILASDGKGSIGYGFAKANELTDAIKKAGEAARKDMKKYVKEGTTIPHEAKEKSDGCLLLLKPIKRGGGLIAGSKPRDILESAGYKDVMVKSLGSNNPINLVKATFKALKSLRSRKSIRSSRGLKND